jgi:hypothetical protein
MTALEHPSGGREVSQKNVPVQPAADALARAVPKGAAA